MKKNKREDIKKMKNIIFGIVITLLCLFFPTVISLIANFIRTINPNILHIGASNWLNLMGVILQTIIAAAAIIYSGKMTREQIRTQHEENKKNNNYQKKIDELNVLKGIVVALLNSFKTDDIFRKVQLMTNAKQYNDALFELDKTNNDILGYRDKLYIFSDLKELNSNIPIKNIKLYDDYITIKENINNLINKLEQLNLEIIIKYREYIYKLLNNSNCMQINNQIDVELERLQDMPDQRLVDELMGKYENDLIENRKNIISKETLQDDYKKLNESLEKYNNDIPMLIKNLTEEINKYLKMKEYMILSELD